MSYWKLFKKWKIKKICIWWNISSLIRKIILFLWTDFFFNYISRTRLSCTPLSRKTVYCELVFGEMISFSLWLGLSLEGANCTPVWLFALNTYTQCRWLSTDCAVTHFWGVKDYALRALYIDLVIWNIHSEIINRGNVYLTIY